MRFSRHVLDVDDLWSHVPRRTTSHKQVGRLIRYGRKSKVNYDRLFTQYYVVWLEVPVDDVLPSHLGQSPQNALHDELSLV